MLFWGPHSAFLFQGFRWFGAEKFKSLHFLADFLVFFHQQKQGQGDQGKGQTKYRDYFGAFSVRDSYLKNKTFVSTSFCRTAVPMISDCHRSSVPHTRLQQRLCRPSGQRKGQAIGKRSLITFSHFLFALSDVCPDLFLCAILQGNSLFSCGEPLQTLPPTPSLFLLWSPRKKAIWGGLGAHPRGS